MGAKGRRVRVLGKRMIINLNNSGGVRKYPEARKPITSRFRECMRGSGRVTGDKVRKCWAEARGGSNYSAHAQWSPKETGGVGAFTPKTTTRRKKRS